MAVLDHFMGEVLADVDVLSTLTSADYVISPFDARRIVFVDGVSSACGHPIFLSRLRR